MKKLVKSGFLFALTIILFTILSCYTEGSKVTVASQVVLPVDSRVVNVRDFGAKGDGVTDDTTAIQAAIANPDGRSFIYLPNGTYLVSKTLIWPSPSHIARIVQGQSQDGTIIKLKDKAASFDDPKSPKAVLSTFEGDSTGSAFRDSIYDLTVDVGSGNEGAYGIRFTSNNQGGIRNVTIRSDDGQGPAGLALDKAWPGPSMIKNLRVVGFDYGIFTASPEYSLTFDHITLENQKIAGINNTWNLLSIRGLTSRNTVPVIKSEGVNPNDGRSFTVVIDGSFTGGSASNAAIELNAGNVFVRDITTSGYKAVIKKGGIVVPSTSVAEYVSGKSYSLFSSPQKSLNLPVVEVPTVPWDDVNTWANVEAYGANGTGNDGNVLDHADWANARLNTPSGETYLSDLTWISAINGFGPVEKDRSNGEINASDGRTIALKGKTYAKGLGVHAPSEIRYNLGGKYSTFIADVGVDDEVGGNGSVVFEVWADGERLYNSGVIYGNTATKQVKVSMAGKQELKLLVTDANDDTAAIQAALDAGKTTVYFPHGNYQLSDTLRVRGNVRRIIGLESSLEVTDPLRSQTSPVFRFEGGTQDVVVLERFATNFGSYKYTWFEHASPKTLVLKNIAINSAKAYRNTTGAGRLFIEDVVGGDWVFDHQEVWARQLNPENEGTKIVNNGGKLWILGLKTEKAGTVVETKAGGKTEILGGLLYPVQPVPAEQPAFINDGSSLSVSIAESCYASDYNYKVIVKETRDGVTKTLPNTAIPGRTFCSFTLPLYVGNRDETPF